MATNINAVVLEVQDTPRAAVRAGSMVIETTDKPLNQPVKLSNVVVEALQTFPNPVILAK